MGGLEITLSVFTYRSRKQQKLFARLSRDAAIGRPNALVWRIAGAGDPAVAVSVVGSADGATPMGVLPCVAPLNVGARGPSPDGSARPSRPALSHAPSADVFSITHNMGGRPPEIRWIF